MATPTPYDIFNLTVSLKGTVHQPSEQKKSLFWLNNSKNHATPVISDSDHHSHFCFCKYQKPELTTEPLLAYVLIKKFQLCTIQRVDILNFISE